MTEPRSGEWIRDEFRRAAERAEELPLYARPVVTRPIIGIREREVMTPLDRQGALEFVYRYAKNDPATIEALVRRGQKVVQVDPATCRYGDLDCEGWHMEPDWAEWDSEYPSARVEDLVGKR